MNRVGCTYVVKAKIELTREDIEFLCDLARDHYDATCRGSAVAGRDAFLHGARVLIQSVAGCRETDTIVEDWSFRECDIARKTLESARYLSEPKSTYAAVLDGILRSAQELINHESVRLNS